MAHTYRELKDNPEILKQIRGKVELLCENCGTIFVRDKDDVYSLKVRGGRTFCSKFCSDQAHIVKQMAECDQCHKTFLRRRSEVGKYKHTFCSLNCSTTYHNTHKTIGIRRSRLEIWLEEQLRTLYSDLEILFNRKEAINSELDIHFPTLNLAFELNGIYHYEPIHGQEKLASIQNNDSRKFQACFEKGIELCIIDSSQLNYFKPAKAQKYLDIITNIINIKLCGKEGS